MRTILIHLNVQASDDDPRGAEEIGASVVRHLGIIHEQFSQTGGVMTSTGHPDLSVTAPLIEEVVV